MVKILIVDDVKEYLDRFFRVLSSDYEMVQAASLDEAKAKMDNTIKLALVDVRLSEKDTTNRDGLIFLGWLKENYPDVPVIMMSAYRDFDAAVDALNLGARRYFKKPINIRELQDLIQTFIKKET